MFSLFLCFSLSDKFVVYEDEKSAVTIQLSAYDKYNILLKNCENVLIDFSYAYYPQYISIFAYDSNVELKLKGSCTLNCVYSNRNFTSNYNFYAKTSFSENLTQPKYYTSSNKIFYWTGIPFFGMKASNYSYIIMFQESVYVSRNSTGIAFIDGTRRIDVINNENITIENMVYSQKIYGYATKDMYITVNSRSFFYQWPNKASTALIYAVLSADTGYNHVYYSGPFLISASLDTRIDVYSEELCVATRYSKTLTINPKNNVKQLKKIVATAKGYLTFSSDFTIKASSIIVDALNPTTYNDVFKVNGQTIDFYYDTYIPLNLYMSFDYQTIVNLYYDVRYRASANTQISFSIAYVYLDLSSLNNGTRGYITKSEIDKLNEDTIPLYYTRSLKVYLQYPTDQFITSDNGWYTYNSAGKCIKINQIPDFFRFYACLSDSATNCPADYVYFDDIASINSYINALTVNVHLFTDYSPSKSLDLKSYEIDVDVITNNSSTLNIKFTTLKNLTLNNAKVVLTSSETPEIKKVYIDGDCSLEGKDFYVESITEKSTNSHLNVTGRVMKNSSLTVQVTKCEFQVIAAQSLTLVSTNAVLDSLIANNLTLQQSGIEIKASQTSLNALYMSGESLINCPQATFIINSAVFEGGTVLMKKLESTSATFSCNATIDSLICSEKISITEGYQTIQYMESATIYLNSFINVSTIATNTFLTGASVNLPQNQEIKFYKDLEELTIKCSKTETLKLRNISLVKVTLEKVKVVSDGAFSLFFNHLITNEVEFPENTEFGQCETYIDISLKELSSKAVSIKWSTSYEVITPKITLSNYNVDFQNIKQTVEGLSLEKSTIKGCVFIINIEKGTKEYTFESDVKTNVTFESISSFSPLVFKNVGFGDLKSMNVSAATFDNSDFDGVLYVSQGKISSTNENMQALNAYVVESTGITLENIKLKVINNVAFLKITMYNSLIESTVFNNVEHSAYVDYLSLERAKEMPDNFTFTLLCTESFGIRDAASITSFNLAFDSQWLEASIKPTQSLIFDFSGIKQLTLINDNDQSYFSTIKYINRPETVKLVLGKFSETGRNEDFPFADSIDSIKIESGHMPYNVYYPSSIEVGSSEAAKFGNVFLKSDIDVVGSVTFENATIESNIEFTSKTGSGKVTANNLVLHGNKLRSKIPVHFSDFWIQTSDALSIQNSITFDNVYINPIKYGFASVEISAEINVLHDITATNKEMDVGSIADCGMYIEKYIPYPPNIDVDGINATIGSVCYDSELRFFIPNELDDRQIVTLSSRDTLIIILTGISAVLLLILSLILIVYRRYKRGDFNTEEDSKDNMNTLSKEDVVSSSLI